MKAGIQYTKNRHGLWTILWLCPKTGDVLEELTLPPSEPEEEVT
jgi:hypothetical protein